MKTRPVLRWIIQSIRRLSVIAAAVSIIAGYVLLLNYFGRLYGAGQGWENPLLWFACAISALVALIAICWALTRLALWVAGRIADQRSKRND